MDLNSDATRIGPITLRNPRAFAFIRIHLRLGSFLRRLQSEEKLEPQIHADARR
jgi:hypothetical protein